MVDSDGDIFGDVSSELHPVSTSLRSLEHTCDEGDLEGGDRSLSLPLESVGSSLSAFSPLGDLEGYKPKRATYSLAFGKTSYASPIAGFVGANGGGKTLAMINELAIPSLLAGRPVVSNFEIAHPLWSPLESWRQIPSLRNCVLLLDEITSCLPSRSSASMPPELQRVMNQLRKVDVILGWSAPHWSRADVILREVTQTVTVCAGYLSDPYVRTFPDRKKVRGENGKPMYIEGGWAPNTWFRWATYDAIDWEDYNASLVERIRPLVVRFHSRKRGFADQVYDTSENVMLLDHVDQVGTCVHCGGRKAAKSCKCAAHVA